MKIRIRYTRLITDHIELRYNYQSHRFTFSTGVKIEEANWDKKKQRQRPRTKACVPNNNRLDLIESKFKSLLIRYTEQAITPALAQIRYDLRAALGELPSAEEDDLLIFGQAHIEAMESGQKLNKGRKYALNTIELYRAALNVLRDYARHSHKKNIPFSTIDRYFVDDLNNYLSHVRGIAPNSAGSIQRFLKVILREAQKADVHNFKIPTITIQNELSEAIYLNQEELEALRGLDLTDQPKSQLVRDLFLVGAWTGLRYSDLSNLQPNNIVTKEQRHYITLTTKKRSNRLVIPLKASAHHLLIHHILPSSTIPSLKTFNATIKEIGKLAQIDTHTTLKAHGGIQSGPKYQFIYSHTARRSFATNAYIAGVPTLAIMAVTGHKTEDMLRRYIRVGDWESATIIADHKHFE